MATITVGGLATGLDTNKIIDQLVTLERRPLDLLGIQRSDAQAKDAALQSFNTKVLAFLSAVDSVRDKNDVLVRKATSSDTGVVSAVAEAGATAGTTTITVGTLARNAVATSTVGVASATATIASGTGSFSFRVGTGDVQTIAVTATTTLQDLTNAINDLNAGATATVVNLGTAAAPDYRLQLVSSETGTSHDLTVVADATNLGVSVTQTAQNASFTLSGFADPVIRESNTVGDLIPGVTLSLKTTGGPVTITVATDNDGVSNAVQSVVKAFNDVVTFVAGQSTVSQDTTSGDREVSAGPLAFDGTVRSILDQLHDLVSNPTDLSGRYTTLGQIGIATARDGTLTLDATKLAAALDTDSSAVGELFGGTGDAGSVGVADRLHDYLSGITESGGLIDVRGNAITEQIKRFDADIVSGQRNLDAFEETLRARFAALEVLVNTLKSQGAFLQNALGGSSS